MLDKEKGNSLFTDAILLAALSAVGYISSYLYQSGFKGYYSIPNIFIDVQLQSIISVTWDIVGALFRAFAFSVIGWLFPKRYFKVEFGKWEKITMIQLFLLFYFGNSTLFMIIAVLILPTVLVIEYLIPYLKTKLVKNVRSKTKLNNNTSEGRDNIYSYLKSNYGYKTYIIIIIAIQILVNLFLVAEKGKTDAKTKTTYLVFNNPKTMVVLDTYKDFFIVAPLDEKKREIQPIFSLLKHEASGSVSFYSKKIGPISVADSVYNTP